MHKNAKASHYDKEAEYYDALNEKNSALINQTIDVILKKYGAKRVLDLACGTGSQAFWLAKRGLFVTGCDINSNMLKIARSKAKKQKSEIKFMKGDMRYTQAGKFDAVITIFNAIGHLTKHDFEEALQNIHSNLKDDGVYLFDICNKSYFLKDDHITHLTIDWQKTAGDTKVREIQYSTIDNEGILASFTTSYVQKGTLKPQVFRSTQTLQIYTAKELKELLHRNGFKVAGQCGIDRSKFSDSKTERIVTIAKKQ